jgi:phosphoglycerate dehydrogenase-like enzyme
MGTRARRDAADSPAGGSAQVRTWQIGVGRTVRGLTLGIYGYGRIGETVAGYGKVFGMEVLVWATRRANALEHTAMKRCHPRTRSFERCDIVMYMSVDATRGIAPPRSARTAHGVAVNSAVPV